MQLASGSVPVTPWAGGNTAQRCQIRSPEREMMGPRAYRKRDESRDETLNLMVETNIFVCRIGLVDELSWKPIAGITRPYPRWKVPTICASYPAKLGPWG